MGDLRAGTSRPEPPQRAIQAGDPASNLGAVWRGLLIAAQSDDVAADGVRALLERAVTDAKARLATARASGELRADADLDMAVEIIYGPLYHAWLLRARPLPKGYMKEILTLVFDGLKPATESGFR